MENANDIYFSIIIPTYNRAHLILKTLRSVFDQSFTNYEIIVIDNASTDNTKQVLAELIQQNKIRFIEHDKNYERSRSRNTGMENAYGKYVTFLDSDDLMYADNLKDAFHFLEHNNYKIAHNLYELINEDSEVLYHYKFKSITDRIKAISEGNFLSCIGVFIAKEIYTKYKFDTNESLQGIEDWEFWMRILADYEVGRINKINSGIVHHQGRSINAYDLESFITKSNYILQKFEKDKQLSTIYSAHFKRFKASCMLLAATQANSANLFKAARKFCRRALIIQPGIFFTKRYLRISQKALFGIKNEKGI